MMMTSTFNESIRASFAFLEANYQFRLLDEQPNYFRFESERVVVVLAYDQQRSYEINLALGQQGDPQPLFDLGEVLRSRKVESDKHPTGYYAQTNESARNLVLQMADLLKRYGADLLRGDTSAWRELKALREKESAEYAHQRDLGYARSDANAAWNRRDFFGVIRALSPWQASLSPADLKRLEYAKKQIRQGP